jgi:hypothetical protein
MFSKRVSLVLAITLVTSLLTILGISLHVQGSGNPTPPSSSAKTLISKLLRRRGSQKLSPTEAEKDLLRKRAQEGEPNERVLEDKIPKHVPIKIKIKAEKEKAFKDLNNENWHRDFELEVKNTSNKPIYFLAFMISLPEVISPNGNIVGTSVVYGRYDFVHFNTRPIPEDIPIQPGETYTFKIPEHFQKLWEDYEQRTQRPNPKRVEVLFAGLSFGDGTGFNGTDGKAYPYKREQSTGRPCREGPLLPPANKAVSKSSTVFAAFLRKELLTKKTGSGPAGYFYALGSLFLRSTDADPQSQLCCPGTQCWFHKDGFYSCACQIARGTEPAGCSDPEGSCSIDIVRDTGCASLGVGCSQSVVGPCEEPPPPPSPAPPGSPSPTPIPSPSPSPLISPCPSPQPLPPDCGVGWTVLWNSIQCQWDCLPPQPDPGGGGPGDPSPQPIEMRQCVDYYWVHFTSYDGGQTWYYADNEEYAGCFYIE